MNEFRVMAGAVLGIIGLVLAFTSMYVFTKTNGKIGEGWAIIAFFFLLSSCQQLGG